MRYLGTFLLVAMISDLTDLLISNCSSAAAPVSVVERAFIFIFCFVSLYW
jgi:hypothetical protein